LTRARVEFRCPNGYDQAKEWALLIEWYKRKKQDKDKSDDDLSNDNPPTFQKEIDDLTMNLTKRKEIELIVKEILAKTRSNQDGKFQKGKSKVIRCYNCQEEGHIESKCPNKNQKDSKNSDGPGKIVGADVRMVELSEGALDYEDGYLQINMIDLQTCLTLGLLKSEN
ncbi:2088_t:CDS:2, partial [Cetraspora pellucida]